MKAKKILNNNVVVVQSPKQKEVIVMGKGIGFGLKVGASVNEEKIDKTFVLDNQQETSRFKELIEQVSEDHLEISEQMIDCAKEQLGKKLNNSIYITLTDHINTMMERAKMGTYLKNSLLWDIRRVHKEEFQAAMKVVDWLNKKYDAHFDEHEAASIAMHFVNAQTELGFSNTTEVTKVISEVLNIIKYHFQINFDEESLSYYRLVVHLRNFAKRLFAKETYSDTSDLELLQHIQNHFIVPNSLRRTSMIRMALQ